MAKVKNKIEVLTAYNIENLTATFFNVMKKSMFSK